VPVENEGDPVTADGHWRETVFGNELMTGFVSLGPQPLSAITLASFVDQGYTVNAGGADSYTLPSAGIQMPGSLVALRLGNDIAPVPIRMLDRNGRPGRIIRR
jgi:hypothetical protein